MISILLLHYAMYFFMNYYESVEYILKIQVEFVAVIFFLHFTYAYASWFLMHFA